MNYMNIFKDIEAKRFKSIYLFYGEEEYVKPSS